MKTYTIEPQGWPCTLEECPPGHFVKDDQLCFKSEYRTQAGMVEAFCCSGEYFACGHLKPSEREAQIVQPVVLVIEDSNA